MFRETPCSSLTTTLNKNQLYPNDGFIIDNIQNKVRLILELFCEDIINLKRLISTSNVETFKCKDQYLTNTGY